MTRLRPEKPRRRSSLLTGLACLGVMTLAVTGCRTATPGPLVNPETGEVLEAAPLRQTVIAVHVVGIQEEVPPDSDAPFPAPGFAFSEDRIVARPQAQTIAGTVLSAAQARAWTDALALSGTAALLLSPVMAVEPGRTGSVSNMTQERYTANFLFDRTGSCTSLMESAWTGARVEAFSATCPHEDALLVSLDVNMTATETPDFEIAEGFRSDDGSRVPPLKIQLPERTVRRWQASALVPYGQSVVMAHWVRQYRITSLLGGGKRMREHIVCLATAGEKPPPVEPDVDKEPYTAERVHYPVLLAWYRAPRTSAAPPLPDETAMLAISAEELAQAILPFRQNAESEAVCVGFAAVPGHGAAGDITKRRTYVTDVTRPVEEDLNERRTFVLSEATEGVECSIALEVEEPLPRVHVRGFLGGPCQLRTSPDTRRSLRTPPSNGVDEAYRFQTRDQDCAEVSSDIRTSTGKTFRIVPPWTAAPSSQGRRLPMYDSLILFDLGEPIAPDP